MPSSVLARWRPEFAKQPTAELLDWSLFLLVWATVGYILLPSPMATLAAVGAPLVVVSEHQLGVMLALFALVGVACSMRSSRVELGYKVMRVAVLFMLLNFVATLVRLGLSGLGFENFSGHVDWATILRSTLLNVLIFGSILRRLNRGHIA